MRPIRLELKGFTAFRDEQEIDFEGLDLFAVSGQTGSGKSSLLDAMTYALFGYVERVGKQVGQLVSQGQPRLAVKLEFAVGKERYRVTRSTPSAKGATKILLERWAGDEWRQAGEGADRVRDADAMIEGIVGLDYDAFTRSVLLPQGKFQEFLVGDAKDRRKILTELLGLDLFIRLAARAGELKRTAAAQADAKEGLLETEYAGITQEAVDDAELVAKEAAARDRALAAAESKVVEIAERWAETARSVGDLRAGAKDAREAAGVAGAVARSLATLAERLAEADAQVKELAKVASATAKAAEKAERARAKAETEWGRATDLGGLRAKAERLADLGDELSEAEAELKEWRRARPRLEKALEDAERLLAVRGGDAEAAIRALDAAKTAVERAQHADHVAAVRVGLHPGDACPVCGARVESVPKTRGVQTQEKAKAARDRAESAAAQANDALDGARAARDLAERTLRDTALETGRLEKEAAKLRREFAPIEAQLARTFGDRLPADPVAAIDERIGRLEALEAAEGEAAGVAAEAKEAAARAERELMDVANEAAGERGRLDGLAVSGLFDRGRALVGSELTLPVLPSTAAAKDAPALGAAAAGLADGLEELAEGLELVAAARVEREGEALAEAAAVVEGLVEPQRSLADLVVGVAEERRSAAATAATAARDADELRRKLDNARALVGEVAAQRKRVQRFGALAAELRADRIIAFLQFEALQILAAAGSERLSTLSDGRYRLRYEGDEFFVVDTWNGEERRSARTLSGGETFLAALGLALALSEQVQSLAVTERARLESLFLDEGFGTLDPETLETVVDAIEQLGGDGRMVGVITHVQELAIRLPVRIEVEKSPRGSRLAVVS